MALLRELPTVKRELGDADREWTPDRELLALVVERLDTLDRILKIGLLGWQDPGQATAIDRPGQPVPAALTEGPPRPPQRPQRRAATAADYEAMGIGIRVVSEDEEPAEA